ncbi:MAG: GxxExxY protein [Methylophilaceae bacterium]
MDINQVTEQIIGCAYVVSNTLGSGFLEKVYENSMAIELRKAGLLITQQAPIQVEYNGIVVGDFFADLVINDCVLVELKAVKALDSNHAAQCMNYLKATGYKICLLINFGTPKIELKRVIL